MQNSFTSLACFILLLSFVITSSLASSQRSLPLKRYAHTTNFGIDILSRQQEEESPVAKRSSIKQWLKRKSADQVIHTDKIRLYFHAFDQDFFLHLEPTENLIHPDGAQVRYVGRHPETGQETVREEKIYSHDIRAFRGVVMHPEYTARRMIEDKVGVKREGGDEEGVMGPAAIMLHDDGSESGRYSFEGTFNWAGNEHTIQLPVNYHNTRQDRDPSLSRRSLERGTPIVHRSSDIMTTLEARDVGIETEEQSSSCSADKHLYNTQNHLFLTETNNDEHSFSPMSFFASPLQSQQLSARSLFPILGSSASQLLRSSKRAATTESHYSYDLLKRQSGGDDTVGGSANGSFIGDIGSISGCPTSARVVYMGLASDCAYTGRFTNSSGASTAILTNMNTVSNIYRSAFKLSLGVVQLEIRESSSCSSTTSPTEPWNIACTDSVTLDNRLSLFSQWRGTQPANGIGLWHLLTSCTTSSEVGVAWLGTLCDTGSNGQGNDFVSGTAVTGAQTQEAQVMAHEIGHNHGAVHDCVSGCSISGSTAVQSSGAVCCPLSASSCNTNAQYIMSPVTSQVAQIFSPCSIGNICSMLGGGLNTTCVNDPTQNPRETLSLQQCGNGILEPGEECDAGPNGSACCSTSCQLTSGSVCDPGTSACCNDSCQFASSSTVCRPAVDTRCDTAETCTGFNATCPTDVRSANGDSCGSGSLVCASGRCTSRDLQCQSQSISGMNLTQACSLNQANSCSISCRNPSSSSSCLILQSQFIDGTECGYGGFCQSGECQSGSWQSTVDNWYRDNLNIAIPVTIVGSIIILAILYCIVRSCCRRARPGSRKNATIVTRSSNPAWTNTTPSSNFVPPPPPSHNRNQWVDPHSFNGPSPSQGNQNGYNNNGYPTYR